MDHYLTTYRKSYLWPKLGPTKDRTQKPQSEVSNLSAEDEAFYEAYKQWPRPPGCRCPPFAEAARRPPPADGGEGGWSRAELVMGPLLDPKMYPVRVGASPETPTSRYNQPNAFLDKLQAKYPMLYAVLQKGVSSEVKQRVDRDRNKSTYQVDYCESGPGAEFDNLRRAADESGQIPCQAPLRLPGDPCRVGPKLRAPRVASISKQVVAGGKCGTSSGSSGT
ncbi:hypothetical protein EVAR_83747_1 [Eumeta japonica]|uniref:Uncharacterized protein n=1 Tax=Eumeta variegata TaxID=151549 RepID=A0A4C1WD02_EUMVA|nr:hypothetical protein EVAR_83747_1 [Eumeta japonica]